MAELKPCPFCGNTDIRYSLKITGHFDIGYHASMYCNKCHCYGARTLTEKVRHTDYKGRTAIEKDEAIKQKAMDAWNRRTEEMNEHDVSEQAYKNGYSAGYVAGRRSAGKVHGRWAHIGEDCCVCSVCHKSAIVDYYFCPECGAEMDLPQITDQTKDALMKMGENAHGGNEDG